MQRSFRKSVFVLGVHDGDSSLLHWLHVEQEIRLQLSAQSGWPPCVVEQNGAHAALVPSRSNQMVTLRRMARPWLGDGRPPRARAVL